MSDFSGVALSVYAIAYFFMSFFYNHQQNKSMLNTLYGDDGNLGDRVPTRNNTEYGTFWATKSFEKRLKSRIELKNNFCFNLIFGTITSMCCCFKTCCNRVSWIRKGTVKYKKF